MHKQPNETTEQFLERQQQGLKIIKAKKAGSKNPKKNMKVRRARGKLAVFVPWVLLNLQDFQTVHYPKRKKQNPQLAINNDLFHRAKAAKRQGGYHNFEKLNRGKK